MAPPGAGETRTKVDTAAEPVRQPKRWSDYWKPAWRRVKRAGQAGRRRIADSAPPWMRKYVGPIVLRLDSLFVDHGIFRLFYLNRHRLGEHAWRSAQPAPHHIRGFARRGVRTIVNLRGERLCGSYWLERDLCERYGIKLVNFEIRSRAAPTRDEIRRARELFDRIEYPMLMHCKSGADRAGMMSALYRLFREGAPVTEAKRELSLLYGHIRQADTGILDRVFERYLEDNSRQPMPFMEWVDTVYDPDELKRTFRATGWARRLVDQILRRE
jgi:protein tyrosine/serine phosphatase